MSTKYDKAADLLQHAVKQDEIYLDPLPKFEEDFVRMNIVHIRQDVIGLYSHLSSLNQQTQTIKYLLVGILLSLVVLIFK